MKISANVILALTAAAAASCLSATEAFVVIPRAAPVVVYNTITKTKTGSALFSTTEDSKTDTKAEVVTAKTTSSTTTPTSKIPVETTVAAVPKVAQRWRKSTKQLATLGPASSNLEMIEKLFLAGADCFRLNYSHGSQEQKKELLMTIREIEEKYSHPIGILGDLQGPKLRVSCCHI
jgi:Pyruvate kinase, barrel domain